MSLNGRSTRYASGKNDQKGNSLRIALIQRFARHDKTENIRRGLEAMSKATAEGAQVVVFAGQSSSVHPMEES